MKKSVLRYGGFASLFIILFFLLDWTLLPTNDYGTQEILGWVGIFLSLIFIFFGIKYYRDRQNNGVLSFGKGMQVGLFILLMPAAAFSLLDVFYMTFIDPEFLEKYYSWEISKIKTSLSATEAAVRIQEMEKEKEMFSSPLVQYFVMFLSVVMPGVIVTVISALILRRSATHVEQKNFLVNQ